MRDHLVTGILALVGAALASGDAPPRDRSTPAAAPPLPVLVAGCGATRTGAVCEVAPAQPSLTAWVDASSKTPVARCGPRVLPVVARPVDGGVQLTVGLAEVELPCRLSLERVDEGGAVQAAWSMTLEGAATHPTLAGAEKLRQAGKLDEAQAALGDPAALGPEWRGRGLALQGRLAMARGQNEAAAASLRASIEAHRAGGRASDQVRDAQALTYLLSKQSRFVEARAALAEADAALPGYDEGRPHTSYYRALMARDTGAMRTALRELEAAERGATRLGLRALRDDVIQVTAYLLQSLGRSTEALRLVDKLSADLSTETDPCKRAAYAGSIANVLLLGGEQTELPRHTDRARQLLAGALEDFRRCPRAVLEQVALVNLAWAEVLGGAFEGSEATLAEAVRRGAEGQPALTSWVADLRGRAALGRGKPRDALRHFDHLAKVAASQPTSDAAWRAAAGRGEALEALHRLADARASYAEAEELLVRLTSGVPLSGGRGSYLAGHERSARRLVDLLMRGGAASDALEVVRRARARALAFSRRMDRLEHLDAASRTRWDDALARHHRAAGAAAELSSTAWSVPASSLHEREAEIAAQQRLAREALEDGLATLGEAPAATEVAPSRPAGEAILAFHPSRGERYWVFLSGDEGVRAERVELPAEGSGTAAWGRALLGPFASELRAARSVRVLPYGRVNDVDVHALPFDGAPLIASRPVRYAMDLAPLPTPVADAVSGDARGTKRRGLVVADPSSDLVHALAEGTEAAQRLATWEVTSLAQSGARRSDVLAALPRVDLLHFAGHGVFEGIAGWESRLELADAPLSLGDVLALPDAPRWVVLSSCRTARTASESNGVDLSLAHAFLVAGTSAVLAATRDVPDALGQRLASSLYGDAAGSEWNLPSSATRALSDLARENSQLDWAAYRLVTR